MVSSREYGDDFRELLQLPGFSVQDELLAIPAVTHTVDSDVPDPVAHVRIVDSALPVDQVFDYEIPRHMAEVRVGCRVVVQFGSRKVDALIIARDSQTAMGRSLRPLLRVVSYMPVLTPRILQLCETIAAQYCGPIADCLRLAVPQRHARTEKEFVAHEAQMASFDLPSSDDGIYADYECGAQFLDSILQRDSSYATMHLLASHSYADAVIPAITATLSTQRTVLVLAPTPYIADRMRTELQRRFKAHTIAYLTAQDEPALRYENFLMALSGTADILVGTRSAAWAPMDNLGLAIILDDLHSAYRERRSPYPHARSVLRALCELSGASMLSVSYWPSPESLAEAQAGGALYLHGHTNTIRANIPQVLAAQDFAREEDMHGRMPDSVFSVVREALQAGPVLISVPQAGYLSVLVCARCSQLARCGECGGTLEIPDPSSRIRCVRCGSKYDQFSCPRCANHTTRALRVGSSRTAEEIGRAFPGITINVFNPSDPSFSVDATPKIVVATTGSEDRIEGTFAASILLDAHYLLRSIRSEAESYFLRSLAKTASVTARRANGGVFLIVGNVDATIMHSFAHWDARQWWGSGAQERALLSLPPYAVWVAVSGDEDSVLGFTSAFRSIVLANRAQAGSDNGSAAIGSLPGSLPHRLTDEGGLAYGNTVDGSNEDLETLLLGGIHDLIPGVSILGPHTAYDGSYELYFRCDPKDMPQMSENIRKARALTRVSNKNHKVRIVVNPSL
ncbi:MAG: hypothetical protein PUK40_07360 [Actinomycetaceae bacterium]|nr:hypothetical protein [Arcanobacterium sp.]MDD7505739.1 hypothetical protein [Actinomycetaceae bacterium]MDY6143662.1 hypothetical protein [Arcanobacterium sp.]